MKRRDLMAWALVAGWLVSGPRALAEAPKTIVGRFVWPEGVLGKMTYSHTKSPKPGDAPRTLDVTYDMKVTRNASGQRIIAWSNPVTTGELSDAAAGVGQLLERMQPPITVDKAGQFVSVAPGAVESMLRMMARPGDKKLPPEALQMAEAMFETRSRHIWDAIVGRWSSKQMKLESSYPVSGQTQIAPGMPALDVSGTGHISALSPCPSGAKRDRCLEITESSTVSTAGLRTLLNAMAAKLGSDLPSIAKRTDVKHVAFRWRLITDPATLLPRSLRNEKEVAMSFDGMAKPVELDVEEWAFSYAAGLP